MILHSSMYFSADTALGLSIESNPYKNAKTICFVTQECKDNLLCYTRIPTRMQRQSALLYKNPYKNGKTICYVIQESLQECKDNLLLYKNPYKNARTICFVIQVQCDNPENKQCEFDSHHFTFFFFSLGLQGSFFSQLQQNIFLKMFPGLINTYIHKLHLSVKVFS